MLPSIFSFRPLFLLILASAALTSAGRASAQSQPAGGATEKKKLTAAIVHENEGGVNFGGSWASGMNWVDSEHFLHRRDGKLMKVNALTDAAEAAYDDEKLKQALLSTNAISEEAAEKLKRNPGTWSADRTSILIRHEKKAFLYRVADAAIRKLSDDTSDWQEIALGPSGRRLAYVRKNDLYVVDVGSRSPRRITRDGNEVTLNGILDWVYQEELYGRGNWRAHWWSADDEYLAFFRLDESQVPVYRVIDPIPYRQDPENWRYPKAGDPNPGIRLGIARARDGHVEWVDLSKYKGTEILIVQVSWSPDGKLIYSVQDREQRWMDVNEANPRSGRSRTLLREETPAFVENTEKPLWIGANGFLWLSDRDGYKHIYFYDRDGALVQRITQGEWEVRDILAVDEFGGFVYFSAEIDSPLHAHLYRVNFAGGAPQRLTDLGFSHSAQVAPRGALFIDTYGNTLTPNRVALRRSDGSLVRMISENPVQTLSEYALSTPQFVRAVARDGQPLNAVVLRPPDYDPTKKYPVWCPIYAGPHAPVVHDSWSGGALADQLLASDGVIVWRCDPRSASGSSSKDTWNCYMRMGPGELADIEDGLKWLIAQGGVDESRIGIEGHSYGGYMTCYALTHSTMFKCGIAGAPVTDWRNYDSIYTERYMRLPANNAEGYDRGSVIPAAKDLHGRLLIAHGLMDENVHMANTAQFIRELQKNRKQFDLMLYPRDRHGFHEGARHWRDMRMQFIRENL